MKKLKTGQDILLQTKLRAVKIPLISESKKNKIIISITKQPCSDGMSEKKYNYKVEVVLNGNKYSGCAIAYGENI